MKVDNINDDDYYFGGEDEEEMYDDLSFLNKDIDPSLISYGDLNFDDDDNDDDAPKIPIEEMDAYTEKLYNELNRFISHKFSVYNDDDVITLVIDVTDINNILDLKDMCKTIIDVSKYTLEGFDKTMSIWKNKSNRNIMSIDFEYNFNKKDNNKYNMPF